MSVFFSWYWITSKQIPILLYYYFSDFFLFVTRTLFARLFVRVGILLTCGKYLHDRIYFHLNGRFGPYK